MKKLLLVGLILYNVIFKIKCTYDYEDLDGKRSEGRDARRSWRRRVLSKSGFDRPWETSMRRDYETEHQHYGGDSDKNRELSFMGYGGHDDYDKRVYAKSSEYMNQKEHLAPLGNNLRDKDANKKMSMNCDRERERFEACFAGCSAVTCDNPRDRLRPCYPFCEPGCICVPPFVRDDRTHKCVHPDDCTKGLKGIPDLTDIEE